MCIQIYHLIPSVAPCWTWKRLTYVIYCSLKHFPFFLVLFCFSWCKAFLSPEKLLSSWGHISERLKLISIYICCLILSPRPKLSFLTSYFITSFPRCILFICHVLDWFLTLLLFWALRFWTLIYSLSLGMVSSSVFIHKLDFQVVRMPAGLWDLFLASHRIE